MKSEYTSVHGLYFDSRQYLVLVSDEMKWVTSVVVVYSGLFVMNDTVTFSTTHVSRYTTLGVLFLVKTNQSWYQRG